MSAELLGRATRALRTDTARAGVATGDARLERALARLERAQRARPRPPRLLRTTAWTLAATLAGAGAWAHATGRVSWFASVTEPAPSQTRPQKAPRSASERVSGRLPSEPAAQLVPEVVAAPALVPPVPEVVPRQVAPAKVAPAKVAPAKVAPPEVALPTTRARSAAAPRPTRDDSQRELADELYREAHAAHFTRGDYAAALAAWDRYLAAAGPAHRWTVEARFNRGVALFRLGQKEAARRALRPFAEGEYGSYRRDEAGRLLEALRSTP